MGEEILAQRLKRQEKPGIPAAVQTGGGRMTVNT
jgi:hypothetical protein